MNLDAHVNVQWLRPESALWDAIAGERIEKFPLPFPSLDLGCGNGVFSFLTAGGDFSREFDWYLNANPNGFRENKDIYDNFTAFQPDWITTKPERPFTIGADHKANLIAQADALGLYAKTMVFNANEVWPLENESFQSVFSNMLYWLDSAERSFAELHRILRHKGTAVLCVQDRRFIQYCQSYSWAIRQNKALELLNRGRSASHLWTVTYDELKALVTKAGFQIDSHEYYLSPLTLKVWDIGLRPLSAVLLKMVNKLTKKDRLSIKLEWLDTVRPFAEELLEMDRRSTDPGGYHLVYLRKP